MVNTSWGYADSLFNFVWTFKIDSYTGEQIGKVWVGANYDASREDPSLPNFVAASTPLELADAIAPDTHITLSEGVYDISEIDASANPYIRYVQDTDGWDGRKGLVIYNLEGLTIRAQLGAKVEIVTPDRFSEVLIFEHCSNINIIGIEAGHSVTGPYECDAGVIYFDRCSYIAIDNCLFYGCGSIGITLRDCDAAHIEDTTVTDCSLRAVDISRSSGIKFINCKFIDNRAYSNVVHIYNTSSVEFTDCEISGNKSLEWELVSFDSMGSEDGHVLFENCIFEDNALNTSLEWVDGSEIMFRGPGISLTNCEVELGNFGAYGIGEDYDLGGNNFK